MATPCVKDDGASSLEPYNFRKGSRSANRSLVEAPSALLTAEQDSEVKASMENGVLTVIFPKTTPEMASKKIQIA